MTARLRLPGPPAPLLPLALAGLADALYLTAVERLGRDALCLPGLDCAAVLASPYARLLGLPVAGLGAATYAALAAAALLALARPRWRRLLALSSLALATAGASFSAYLTWASLIRLRAACPWCLLSAAVMALIWLLALRWAWQAA